MSTGANPQAQSSGITPITAVRVPKPVCVAPSIGLVLSMGSGAGIMFAVAHELLHSKDPMERLLANSLLSTAAAQHWTLSHLAHHVKASYVSTPWPMHMHMHNILVSDGEREREIAFRVTRHVIR